MSAVQNGVVLDSLLDAVSSSSWTYLVLFAFAFGDVLFPLLPSETAVIAAGVLAGSGAYLIGRNLKDGVRRRIFRGERRRHLDRAEAALADRGGSLIVIGRFIPGGRSAVRPRFLAFDVLAGFTWASYAALIGYFGGKAFEESPLKGILVALGIAFAIAATIELVRWQRRRRLAGTRPPAAQEPVAGDDRG
jgi:membrane protein DedA with SNARE-associated domain